MKSPLNRGGLRFYLVAIALLAGTLGARATSPKSILAGLPCLLLGAWLHAWAKGCLRQNCVVATSGPYRFVRHPFYLANALIDAGLVVMAGWWPLAAVAPLWWLAIYLPVIRSEERYLAATFPEAYPPYKLRIPRMIPWRRPLPSTGEGFRWQNANIAGGEELPRVTRILAYPLLFLVVQGIGGDGLRWLDDGWNLTAVAGLIMLYALAWELDGHQRQRRWIYPPALRHPALRVVASAIVLAAVWYVPAPKTGFKDYLPISGAALMLLSVPVFARRAVRAVMAETLALWGVIAAGELVWLAPAPVVIYAAWILDYQLGCAQSTCDRTHRLPYWPYFYPILAIAGAVIIGVKLIGHALPYHLAIF